MWPHILGNVYVHPIWKVIYMWLQLLHIYNLLFIFHIVVHKLYCCMGVSCVIIENIIESCVIYIWDLLKVVYLTHTHTHTTGDPTQHRSNPPGQPWACSWNKIMFPRDNFGKKIHGLRLTLFPSQLDNEGLITPHTSGTNHYIR